MLEQQQVWLVHGLQELYRRAQEGEGWVGEPLKAESNGHPLTHDLLTRLGALDHTKGEQFEEDVESMQQKLWQQNAGLMQRQESSDGSSDIAHSPPPMMNSNINNNHNIHHHRPHHNNNHRHHPYTLSTFAEAMNRHQHQQLPPTPPNYSPTTSSAPRMPSLQTIKSEPLIPTTTSTIPTPTSSTGTPSYTNLISHQQGIDPMALQNPHGLEQAPPTPWTGGGVTNTASSGNPNDLMLDDLDLLGNQYALFEDAPQMFGRQQQMPINCLPPSMLFEPNDEFSQYFNTNTEISTI